MSCESTQRICTSSNLQLNLTKPAMRIVVPSVQDRRLHKVARKNIKINVSPCQPLVLRKQSATGRLPLAPIMENDPVLQEDHREQTNECTDFSPEYTFEGSYRLPKKQLTNQQSFDHMPSLCGLKRSREQRRIHEESADDNILDLPMQTLSLKRSKQTVSNSRDNSSPMLKNFNVLQLQHNSSECTVNGDSLSQLAVQHNSSNASQRLNNFNDVVSSFMSRV